MENFNRLQSAFSAHYSSSFRMDGILIYLPLTILAALIMELLVLNDRSKATLFRLNKISSLDWFFYILYQFNISALLGHILTMFSAYFLYKVITRQLGATVGFFEISLMTVPIYFLTLDFFGYWYHRCAHRFSVLWALHEVHHSIKDFNLIAAFRDHPALAALSKIFVALPIVIVFNTLGMPLEISFIYVAIVKLINLLQHSQITSNWGYWGKIVVSPAAHRLHHSTAFEHYDRNFGGVFIIWDKIFGTYAEVAESKVSAIEIGLPDYKSDQNIISCILNPMRDGAAQVVRFLKK